MTQAAISPAPSPPTPASLGARWSSLPVPSVTDAWPVEAGTMDDYALLAEHHYRASRPATASRVLVVRDPRPSAADRFLRRRPTGVAIAVLVESRPTLCCAARDVALRHRYGPPLSAAQRGDLVNRELRCISRIVVQPTYRGVGLAVRLVRHALDTAQTPFTEAIAAMGRVNPFFERAGMTRYPRPVQPNEARLLDAFRSVEITPDALVDRETAWRRVESMPKSNQQMLHAELYRFHAGLQGRRRSHRGVSPRTRFDYAAERLAFQPIYFLHDNRESPA